MKVFAKFKVANVREFNSTDSKSIGQITDKIHGEFVRYTQTINGYRWIEIRYNGRTGYVREDVSKIVEEAKNTYILDAGHGGINSKGEYTTAGKRSPKFSDGLVYYEGVGNRTIAKLVAKKLDALGIKYEFTVKPTDATDLPLSKRVNIANQLHLKTPCVLISIHSNASGNGREWHTGEGYEVFTSPGNTTSDKYADIWFNEMRKEFPEMKGRADRSDGDHDKEARFSMLHVNCPAILIEMAFHTNLKDVEFLRTASGQDRMANVIVRTIQEIEK